MCRLFIMDFAEILYWKLAGSSGVEDSGLLECGSMLHVSLEL
jgi:hypothetical protein